MGICKWFYNYILILPYTFNIALWHVKDLLFPSPEKAKIYYLKSAKEL